MLLLIHFLKVLAEIIGGLSLLGLAIMLFGAIFVKETAEEHELTLQAIPMYARRVIVCGVVALACYLVGR